jgi:hypothetical protein
MKHISDKLFQIKQNIEHDLRPELPSGEINQIETFIYDENKNTLDDTMFYNITLGYTRPVLIKGVYKNDMLKPYTFENLKSKHGDIPVEALKYGDNSKAIVESIKVTFGAYLDMINAGKKYYMTVNNSIANALDKERFMEFYMNILKGTNGFSNIFIGNKDSSTHLHSEIAGSCASQISGVKKWYLIDPKYSEYLNPIPDKNNIFHMSTRGFIKNRDNVIENVPRYEAICESGDFLFVPPWWWHETLNLTDEHIMLSYRPSLFLAPYKTNFIYTILAIRNSVGFNNIMYPLLVKMGVIDQNKDVVVESITEIGYRIPDDIKKKLIAPVLEYDHM